MKKFTHNVLSAGAPPRTICVAYGVSQASLFEGDASRRGKDEGIEGYEREEKPANGKSWLNATDNSNLILYKT